MIGMAGLMEVLRRVAMGRAVAAADVAAGAAQPEVHPARAELEAFLAAPGARRHVRMVFL